jgi:glycosyltransferase involved in cell wall biosynthesis
MLNNKLRILFVLGTFWGENGITSHIYSLAKSLKDYGCEVAFASGISGDTEEIYESSIRAIKKFDSVGIQHYPIPFPQLKISSQALLNVTKSLSELNKIISQFQPDIIHLHSLSTYPFILAMRFIHKVPFVSTCHMEPKTERLNLKFSAFINRHLKTIYGDRVIAISQDLRDAFEYTLKVPKNKIRLIYHGVDSEYFRPPSVEERLQARAELNLEPEAKVICHIGRLAKEKGHDTLFKAVALLKSEGIDVTLLCAGKGYWDEEEVIRAQVTQAGISELVHLLGFVESRQVIWASDMIVLPSWPQSEAFPLVIIEAMLCGVVPIRTPAAGAYDQINDGMNGFIFPFYDSETLVLRLKELTEDDQLRFQMSTAAHAFAQEKFSMDRMTRDTISVYEELM